MVLKKHPLVIGLNDSTRLASHNLKESETWTNGYIYIHILLQIKRPYCIYRDGQLMKQQVNNQ